jgi:hypothetical protein
MKRTMMVPIFGAEVRTGIGSVLFGLTVFTDCAPDDSRGVAPCHLVVGGAD